MTFEGVRYSVEEVFAQTFERKAPPPTTEHPPTEMQRESNRVVSSMLFDLWMCDARLVDGREAASHHRGYRVEVHAYLASTDAPSRASG